MKILFDARIHLNYYSGISRYIICLLEAYATEFPEDEITVLLNPTIQPNNSIYTNLNPFKNIHFKTIDASHMGPVNYLRMGKLIKKMAPDVYHYPHLDAPVFTGNIPVVATVHDSNSNKNIKKFDDKFGLKSHYFKKALRMTLKRAKRVVFVSDSIKKEVLGLYNISENDPKYSRIYNGFEPQFNVISDEKKDEILKELNCRKPYILFVGQIREHKNIRRAVEAFNAFQQKNPTYNLVIIGHNYLNLNLNSSHVQHIETVTNTQLKALYAGCEAFLFPSLFEGFGFPILEAFSFGKPVITTNYGATAEISGGLAVLVDPTDTSAICAGIAKSIISDHGHEARKAHAAAFSWKENAQELRKIYLSAQST